MNTIQRNNEQRQAPGAGNSAGTCAGKNAREEKILARIRNRQLELALSGRHMESAHYAQWAQRVRRFLCKVGICDFAAA